MKMSRTLIVSDNEILSQLYVINLEVYLGTNVSLVLSTIHALKLIDSGEVYDLIITVNPIGNDNSASSLYESLKTQKLKTSLLVIGSSSNEIPDTVVVQRSYNLKSLLCSCAEILGVTSKSMATLVVPEYYSLDIKFLLRLKVAPCEIFLEVKNSATDTYFTMIAKKGSSTVEYLQKFAAEGITNLYVNKLDRILVIDQISRILGDFLKSTEHFGILEKAIALEIGFEFVATNFCQSAEAIQEVMSIASACSRVMGEMSQEVPSLHTLLQLLHKNKNGYIFSHTVLASFIASHIIKKVSWGVEEHLEKINFVLCFHDILLAPIYAKHPHLKYEEELLFSDELNEKDKNLVLNHARLAAELMASYRKIPIGADLLIKQHHGMTNGVGFAVDYRNDISPLSKIIIISECFVEEYMKGKDNDPHFQIDLKIMIAILMEKFKKNTYVKIIETLETLRL